jgi:hypothetical protein
MVILALPTLLLLAGETITFNAVCNSGARLAGAAIGWLLKSALLS